MKLISGGLIGLVRLYQYAISPLMPPHCRFYPELFALCLRRLAPFMALCGAVG